MDKVLPVMHNKYTIKLFKMQFNQVEQSILLKHKELISNKFDSHNTQELILLKMRKCGFRKRKTKRFKS